MWVHGKEGELCGAVHHSYEFRLVSVLHERTYEHVLLPLWFYVILKIRCFISMMSTRQTSWAPHGLTSRPHSKMISSRAMGPCWTQRNRRTYCPRRRVPISSLWLSARWPPPTSSRYLKAILDARKNWNKRGRKSFTIVRCMHHLSWINGLSRRPVVPKLWCGARLRRTVGGMKCLVTVKYM